MCYGLMLITIVLKLLISSNIGQYSTGNEAFFSNEFEWQSFIQTGWIILFKASLKCNLDEENAGNQYFGV